MKKIKSASIFVAVIAIIGFTALNIPGNVSELSAPVSPFPVNLAGAEKVSITLLPTAFVETPHAFTIAQGSVLETFQMVHGAILVQHDSSTILFDTGLGVNADAQFEADMPALLKPLMAYEKGTPAVEQIVGDTTLILPEKVFLSHVHWDHLSGVEDFPEAEIWLSQVQHDFMQTAPADVVFPSQVAAKTIQWHPFPLVDKHFGGFDRSYDIFGDSTVVIVELPGHTPGSIGLFVLDHTGQQRLFVGDAVWNLESITSLRSKFWVSKNMVDDDHDKTNETIAKLNAVYQVNADLLIIPAHDRRMWK